MITMRAGHVIWALAALLAVGTAQAQEAQERRALVITAENLMAGDARHQELAKLGGDANAVLPGDVVAYRLTFTNVTTAPVRAVEFKDPLPAGLRYVAGSAKADRQDVIVSYSIDGGRAYSAEPMIEEVVNGERVTRPAPPEMYTHIRWVVSGWVEPGAQVTAEFRAQLPAVEATEEPGQPS